MIFNKLFRRKPASGTRGTVESRPAGAACEDAAWLVKQCRSLRIIILRLAACAQGQHGRRGAVPCRRTPTAAVAARWPLIPLR